MSRGMWMLFTLIGFAMGGIMYGRILPEKLAHKNVCALSPDHNPGAANVFTYCGRKMGLLCLALDMGKGFLPVFIACRLSGGEYLPCKQLLIAAGLRPDRALIAGLGTPAWLHLCGNCNTIHSMVESVTAEGIRAGMTAVLNLRRTENAEETADK